MMEQKGQELQIFQRKDQNSVIPGISRNSPNSALWNSIYTSTHIYKYTNKWVTACQTGTGQGTTANYEQTGTDSMMMLHMCIQKYTFWCAYLVLPQLEYLVCCCPNHSKTVIGRLGRVQKTVAEMVISDVWKHSVMRKNWKTYIGWTWTTNKKWHVNSNAHTKAVVMKKIGKAFY